MPSHQERVRRNYPEGVPQFGHSGDPDGWFYDLGRRRYRFAPLGVDLPDLPPTCRLVVASPELICAAPAPEPPAVLNPLQGADLSDPDDRMEHLFIRWVPLMKRLGDD